MEFDCGASSCWIDRVEAIRVPQLPELTDLHIIARAVSGEGFQKSVHAAALWYSWISPPSRSRRLIAPRLAGVSAFVASGGSNASPR